MVGPLCGRCQFPRCHSYDGTKVQRYGPTGGQVDSRLETVAALSRLGCRSTAGQVEGCDACPGQDWWSKDMAKVKAEEKIFVASQWQLMWWKFRKHKMAQISGVVLILFALVALFCEFVAPYDPEQYSVKYRLAPPSKIRILDVEGSLRRPFVYKTDRTRHPETLRDIYTEDTTVRYPIKLFVRGAPVKWWGVWKTDIHLFGLDVPHEEQGILLLGADRLGRDLFTRVCYGSRMSLSIGMAGVLMSMTIGVLLGGFSGYHGGMLDLLLQRLIEFIRSIPQIPLWLGLSAALPKDWEVTKVFFAITLIIGMISWTGMAQVVRGRFLALREEDFVMAARLSGASTWRIVTRHMVPTFLSHIIASLTLAIPGMIISETALSFLGLGLRPPAISWGVLLRESQNLRSLVLAPWVLLPGVSVVVSVLAFNFLGDGVRDAVDPYTR